MSDIKILTDKEIRDSKDDLIDFKWFSLTLKRIILSASTPITIGVYGEWGSGKTSIMQLTKKLLEKETKTVWFNAWKYDIAYDLRVALIKTILNEMEKDESIKNKVKDLSKKLNLLGLAKIGASFFIGSPNIDINNVLKQDEMLTLIGEFEEKFSLLVKDFAKDKSLVIFIDDLDRCLPNKVVNILEAIKLFMDVEGCVFVLGLNKDIIEKGIMHKYKNLDFKKENYIEKIIQLSFNIPPLREKDAQDFIENLAPPKIRAYKEIISKVGGNPRRIKRVINKFILQTILSEENPQIEVDGEILAKLSVLELKWNKFYIDLMAGFDTNTKSSKLLSNFQDICKLSPDKRKGFIETSEIESGDYFRDEELANFLSQGPTLWQIDLEQYIFLRMASTIDEIDIYRKIDNIKSDHKLIKDELVELTINKLRSRESNSKRLGLAEIKHGWVFAEDIDKFRLLDELVKLCDREKDLLFKKEITDVIKDLSRTI
jgi:hypothetical protein